VPTEGLRFFVNFIRAVSAEIAEELDISDDVEDYIKLALGDTYEEFS